MINYQGTSLHQLNGKINENGVLELLEICTVFFMRLGKFVFILKFHLFTVTFHFANLVSLLITSVNFL